MFGGSAYALQPGMVLSVEPPVFIPEENVGVRIIDNALITESGSELLSRFPREMIIL
jgi:Xaa-Pro dipeptidase